MPNAVLHNGKVYILDNKRGMNEWLKSALGEVPDPFYPVQDSQHSLRKIGIEKAEFNGRVPPDEVINQLLTNDQKRGLKDNSFTPGSAPLAILTIPAGVTPEEVADLVNNIDIKKGNASQKGEAYNKPELAEELFNKAEKGRLLISRENAAKVYDVCEVSPVAAVMEMMIHNAYKSNMSRRGTSDNLRCHQDGNKFEIWNIVDAGYKYEHVDGEKKAVFTVIPDDKYPDRVRIGIKGNTSIRSSAAEILLNNIIKRARAAGGFNAIAVQGDDVIAVAERLPKIREEIGNSTRIVREVLTQISKDSGVSNVLIDTAVKVADTITAEMRPSSATAETRQIKRVQKEATVAAFQRGNETLERLDTKELARNLEGREVTPETLAEIAVELLEFKKALARQPMTTTLEGMIDAEENARREAERSIGQQRFYNGLRLIQQSNEVFDGISISQMEAIATEAAQRAEEKGAGKVTLNDMIEIGRDYQRVIREALRKEEYKGGDMLEHGARVSAAIQKGLRARKNPAALLDLMLENFVPDSEHRARE